jgi:hypothetical protein
MKLIKYFVLAAFYCHSAIAIDKVIENVQAVCLSPTEQGKYWNVIATGEAGISGSIRLISTGINGEATFTNGEWDGVQQVLKSHQAADNESYRQCVEKLAPLFLEKFHATPSAARPKQTNKKKPIQTSTSKPTPKPVAAQPEPAKDSDIQQETHGDKSPAIVSDEGDVKIEYK